MLRELLKNGSILSHIFHMLILFWSYSQKKIFNEKLVINFNFLPNIDAIWVLMSSKEPNDVRFLAVYTSSVRQATMSLKQKKKIWTKDKIDWNHNIYS